MIGIISDLEDIKKSKMSIDDVRTTIYKFNNYEIKDEWICGNELSEKIEYESLFKKNNKVDMILKLLKIGKLLYEEDEIKKNYYEDYKFKNKNIKKPRIEIDMKTLSDNAIYEIYDFFKTYGIINGDKYNLKILLRKIIEFYCTVKILENIDKKEINSIEDEMLYVLYPQFRKKEKKELSMGIATNIQENGRLKSEEMFSVFPYFKYNEQIKDFEMFVVGNDYIALAYYQLATIIILKKNGGIFPKCTICGDYIENYERSSKSICDKDSCRKEWQREKTARCRARKKQKGENK